MHARPTSTTKPTCVKMLMSICASEHAGDRAEQAHRHDQDHGQRQRPAFVLRGQHQEDQHHRQHEDAAWPCCRSAAASSASSVHSSRIDWVQLLAGPPAPSASMAWPELTPGAGVAVDRGGGVHVVAHDHHRAAARRGCWRPRRAAPCRPLSLRIFSCLRSSICLRKLASAWTLTCQVRPKRLKSLT